MPTKITDDVYKIKGEGNIYVVLGPEPFLIDASDNIDSVYIKKEIEQIIDPKEVKTILLTHLHYDHCGNSDLFPNATVYASKEEIENFKESPDDFFIQGISGVTREMLKRAKILSSEINGLEVIRTPGHTRGSVAFLDRERKLLFSGDTLFENGIGRTDLNNSVPEEMAESLDKLEGLMKKYGLRLCPGHDY